MNIRCPFCTSGDMLAVSPVGIVNPSFRCDKCNIRIVVTNKSYMLPSLLKEYQTLVKEQKLGKQKVKK